MLAGLAAERTALVETLRSEAVTREEVSGLERGVLRNRTLQEAASAGIRSWWGRTHGTWAYPKQAIRSGPSSPMRSRVPAKESLS